MTKKELMRSSNEGQGERTDVLYDFLYRDMQRISSYYAQLFGGRLSSLETTHTSRKGSDKSTGVNAQILKGDLKYIDERQESHKQIIDPHDQITLDVFSKMRTDGRTQREVETAPHGSLVIAKGSLNFVDNYFVDLACTALEHLVKTEKQKPQNKRDTATIASYELLQKILPKLAFHPIFFLQMNNGHKIFGTIKPQGLDEPISSFYVKHGQHGLADVYAVWV